MSNKRKFLQKERSEILMVVTKGNTLLEAVENAKNELQTEKIYYLSEEEKGGLLKSKIFHVTAISYQELITEIKSYLEQIIKGIGLTVTFETNIRDDEFNITMYSDQNSLLIGKNGNTLKALETVCRAKVRNEWKVSPKIILDVENYRDKKIESLERLAIKIAKEVRNTKVDVELDNMNSYERRIIHNKLSNFKGITTTSVGEEPNRHVIIKAE